MRGRSELQHDAHWTPRIHRHSRDGRTILILCAEGHLYDTVPIREWAGSTMEAHATRPILCYGTRAPKEPTP